MRRVLSIVACLLAATVWADTPVTFQTVQNNGGNLITNNTVTNANPGAIFGSAGVQLGTQFEIPFAFYLADSAFLQSQNITTASGLLSNGYVQVTIDTGSNPELVNGGWSAALNGSTGVLSFAPNNPFGWDIWRSSTDGTPHRLGYTIIINKLVSDLNGDGLVQAEERLITEAEGWALLGLPAPPRAVVAAGFEAITDGDFTITAELPRYWLLGAWWERMRAEGLARAAPWEGRQAGAPPGLRAALAASTGRFTTHAMQDAGASR